MGSLQSMSFMYRFSQIGVIRLLNTLEGIKRSWISLAGVRLMEARNLVINSIRMLIRSAQS